MFFSCSKYQERLLNIEIINDHNELSFSTKKEKIYIREYSYFEDEKIDSIKINFSEEDWKVMTKSFIDNKINLFDSINNDIGVRTNSIKFGEKYLITSNQREIVVNYDYFFDENKINKDKTERFKNFVKTLDSIFYSKKQN
jgi:hypothetical protein